MRDHPVIGEQILRQIPGMEQIAKAVRHEHERWDGGGYPDGLAGERIPLASRIVFACDAYHAMVSDRPYRCGAGPRRRDRRAARQRRQPVRPRCRRGAARGARRRRRLVLGCAPSEVEERHRREALEANRVPSSAPRTCSSSARSRATPSRTSRHRPRRGLGRQHRARVRGRARLGCPALGSRAHRAAVAERRAGTDRRPLLRAQRGDRPLPRRRDRRLRLIDRLARRCERARRGAAAERVARLVDHVSPAKRLADELEVLDAVRAVTTVNAERRRGGAGRDLRACRHRAFVRVRRPWSSIARARATRIGWHDGRLGSRQRAGRHPRAARRARRDRPGVGSAPADPGHRPGRRRGPATASAPTTTPRPCTRCRSATSRSSSLVHAPPESRAVSPTSASAWPVRVADGAELVIRRALAQEQLSRENAKLERRASTDPLTGVSNRGGWDESLVACPGRARPRRDRALGCPLRPRRAEGRQRRPRPPGRATTCCAPSPTILDATAAQPATSSPGSAATSSPSCCAIATPPARGPGASA